MERPSRKCLKGPSRTCSKGALLAPRVTLTCPCCCPSPRRLARASACPPRRPSRTAIRWTCRSPSRQAWRPEAGRSGARRVSPLPGTWLNAALFLYVWFIDRPIEVVAICAPVSRLLQLYWVDAGLGHSRPPWKWNGLVCRNQSSSVEGCATGTFVHACTCIHTYLWKVLKLMFDPYI